VSINLAATLVNQTNQGNSVTHTSTFSVDDGVTVTDYKVHDVWFTRDTVDTAFVGSYDVEDINLSVGTVKGHGSIADLHVAGALDNSAIGNLNDLLVDFTGKSFLDFFTDDRSIHEELRDIMFRWAGVDGVEQNSRGEHIDARELAFLEKFMGQDFVQRNVYSDPFSEGGMALQEAFDAILNHVMTSLFLQSIGKDLFEGDVRYNIFTDNFTGITGINYERLEQIGVSASYVDYKEVYWRNVLLIIDHAVGVSNLSSQDEIALESAISASEPTLTLSVIVDSLVWSAKPAGLIFSAPLNGTATGGVGYDTLNGAGGNEILDGGLGGDTLHGQNGHDILIGGQGDDLLMGGSGNDAYHYSLGDGIDSIYEYSWGANNVDKIVFGAGITLNDLTFERMGDTDLLITIDPGFQRGKINIEGMFNYGATSSASIEFIEFSDLSTYTLTGRNWTTYGTASDNNMRGVTAGGLQDDIMYGLGGNDQLIGGLGNDQLYGGDGDDKIFGDAGNDIMSGGEGNDILEDTASGNDIYLYNLGDGSDIIRDWNGADILRFGEGIGIENLSFIRFNTDLIITVSHEGFPSSTIKLVEHFGSARGVVETVEFFDEPPFSLSTAPYTTMGTEVDDRIVGISAGGSINDTIYGLGGNDEVLGGIGNDVMDGGTGNDTLTGGAGNDTFIFSGGLDVFSDSAGVETVRLLNYNMDDIAFKRSGSSQTNLIIEIDGTNQITLASHFTNGDSFEILQFLDSSTVLFANLKFETHGDNNANTINGIVYGGSINDVMYGYGGNDTLNGGTGNDFMSGGEDNDALNGAAGDDIYFYVSGLDIFTDTAGTDIIQFADGISVGDLTFRRNVADLNDLIIEINSENKITLNGHFTNTNGIFETLQFFDSSILNLASQSYETHGNESGNVLSGISYGGSIDDTIYGYGGNDTLNGGAGDDFLNGGSGDDALNGAAGNDTYIFNGGVDVFTDTAGVDVIKLSDWNIVDVTFKRDISNLNNLIIEIDNENKITLANHFTSAGVFETLIFANEFTLDIATQIYETYGNEANNSLSGIVYGGSTNDIIYGNGGNDTLNGGAGDDILDGGDGNDTLNGSEGNDILKGGAGDDSLNGGVSDDLYLYESGLDIVTDTGGSNDTLTLLNHNQANVTFSRDFSDLNDLIIQIDSSNKITVNNQFANNAGIENITYQDLSAGNLSSQIFTTHGNAANNTIAGIVYGGSVNDIIYGYGGNDTLNGGIGDDILFGGDDNDTLNGNDGNDYLDGGAGNDIMAGHTGGDVYVHSAGLDTVTDTGGLDTLRISSSIEISDLSFVNISTYNTKIVVSAGVDEITVDDNRNILFFYQILYGIIEKHCG